jgi:hypothetical protein
MNNYYVYFHKNPITKEIFYVGLGKDKRAWSSKRNIFWKNYVKKYGEPIIEIYKNNISIYQAAELEIELIKKYGRRGYDKDGILLNKSTGGEFTAYGSIKSQKSKDLISLKLKDKPKHTLESKQKIREKHLGRKCSQETKNKMSKPRKEGTGYNISKANKGRKSGFEGHKHTQETKNKIYNIDRNTKISLKLKGRTCPNIGKSILQYDLEGNFIKEWTSAAIAAKELNIKYSQIYRNLTNIQNKQKFIWKYKK